MEGTQNQNDSASRISTSTQEDQAMLKAALNLCIIKHPKLSDQLDALIECIGECCGPFTKKIVKSDINKKKSRLLLPQQLVDDFIDQFHATDKDYVKCVVYNTTGKPYLMQFKKWSAGKESGKKPKPVLMHNWNTFVEENQLTSPGVLQIWALRSVQTGGLCFLISDGSLQVP